MIDRSFVYFVYDLNFVAAVSLNVAFALEDVIYPGYGVPHKTLARFL